MTYIAIVLVVSAASWPPPQMPTAEEFKQIQAFTKKAHLTASATAPADAPAQALPSPVTADAQKAAIERFKNAWFLGSKFFGKQQVEVDVFHLPNPQSTTVKYVWTSAVGADGKSQLKKEAAPAESLDMRSGNAALPLENKDDEAEIVTAKAKVSIESPEGFDEVTLACANAGKQEIHGKQTFTLERCERDVFSLLVDGFDENDLVVPLSASGAALANDESSRGPLFEGGKGLEDITYEQFKKGPGTTFRIEMRGKGSVASVRWMRVKATKKIDLEITAVREPKVEDFAATSRTRYAVAKAMPPFSKVDPKTFPLAFVSGRACAMFGYNAPQIWLQLPLIGNSQFATVEIKGQPKLSGAKGGFELETNGLDEKTARYKWTLAAKKANTILAFASAEVKATVRYPLEIVSVDLGKTKTSADGVMATFAGHKVTLQLPEGTELVNDGVSATDANGATLKKFSYSESNENGETHAFMGTVDKARVSYVRGWVERAVSGKLKPAPLRAKDKAGLCD